MTRQACGWSPRLDALVLTHAQLDHEGMGLDVIHAYRPRLVGLSTRTFTGWLEVAGDGTALYAPQTSKGFVAPPRKKLLLVSNGLFAKYGMWQARRQGTADRLEQLAAARALARGPAETSSGHPQR